VTRKAVEDELIGTAIPSWAILVVQLNNVVATQLGVTDTDVQCLHFLALHGPSTAGELAKRVNLTTGSASRMIDRLVVADCVRRVPDPADRRRVLIEPTPSGIERVSAAYSGLIARTRDDLKSFADREIGTLLRFIMATSDSTEAEIHRLKQG
jgi:DNA-binding MarR family transcriptional regulator